MERLQKVMAAHGIASRRKCEELIRSGAVHVNDQLITQLGYKVNPDDDQITVNGVPLTLTENRTYILLNKPSKVITTVHDPQGRATVLDLIATNEKRLFPVGRLDYETEGLLLLTNDGELANRMTHPRYNFEKEYIATVVGHPSHDKIDTLRNGILLEDGVTSPAKVTVIKNDYKNSKLSITIHEGKNRQVRRMCQAIGHPVVHLQRCRIGFLTTDQLAVGQYRHLTPTEIVQLKKELHLL